MTLSLSNTLSERMSHEWSKSTIDGYALRSIAFAPQGN